MKAFAVQTLPPGSTQPQFVIVAADNAEQALAAAAQQSVEAGQPETALVAVFEQADVETLAANLRQANEQLAAG